MYIINLDSVDKESQGVGLKAASLGALAKAGFLVPKGFVVTTEAFEKFLADTGMSLLLPRILENVSQDEPASAVSAFNQIRELFGKFSGTDFLIRELKGAYNELSFGKDVSAAGGAALDLIRAGRGDCFVSVRPSVASSHGQISFAGHGKAYLNLIGYRQVLAGIKECWLSFFSPEALIYRKLQGIEGISLAVLVQKMVDSELSGTLFTQEPVSGEGRILVEGWWGLGETLCCGCVLP
ncbi:MAG: PEP/pyruvate-binding domain-containing protein, partial [Candidatus Aenigmarchaeota archaeon]|nr:PEP/pyruvate-binding domain-containing protein [Candidatus Aenigmarchaeota archaeon]